jgi:hypothetical protein
MSRVDALLTEREGYVRRNLPARVAQVDAELARFGVVVEVETAEAPPVVERAVAPKAPKRPR